ncbi:sensor histidine kinase [Pedobacter montanisoli]|uniref:histidine kinase n=1 Tax=Pedobacter montanisoli TaxID=2923277 RepID=A0ABS9ZY52_9SPHI|nr:HAMP domain-containing sensor histidine kinase [Pedobacter montanisoli]MCJ0743220.1 HAMP domain-containing histidine kinase [Pedobacter montanisoli]
MKLANQYNKVNLLVSILILLLTGIVYYLLIHFILTKKLDRDLMTEEDEIRQYVANYHDLPLLTSFIDQEVLYKVTTLPSSTERVFRNTVFYDKREKETEPGRSLVTIIQVNDTFYEVTIIKSRVESEDLVRLILLVTVCITGLLLLALWLIHRFLLNRLWQPFYGVLNQMKAFNIKQNAEITHTETKIEEFNELNRSAIMMANQVNQDYKELKNFTDNASHEMMTPLAIVNSKLDSLLQTEKLTEQHILIITDIYDAIARLTKLNQSLLLLTKIENNLLPDEQEIDIEKLFIEKSQQFSELILKAELSFHMQQVSCKVTMSKYLADILLNNLLINAIKYTPAGGDISVVLQDHGFSLMNTAVEGALDTKYFKRFEKSVHSTGTGLGLAIVFQICSLYHFDFSYSFEEKQHQFNILFKK